MRGLRNWFRFLAVALIVAGIAAAVISPQAAANALQLPLFAAFSTTRMVIAYLFSLVFALAYGYTAATNKRASVVMLPVLDVLQSIPILGFFPAALVFFGASRGNALGSEFAVVFLIFTSMAWNIAFGVYESLTTIPQDLESAAAAFGLTGWLRFRLLAFPATIPKLVYNSILSWTNGWFFLVASEIFQAGDQTLERPGLGAFIAVAGQNGDTPSILAGIAVLAAVVLALDIFVWKPLGVWSERFRMETVSGHEILRVPGPYERFRWLPRLPTLRRTLIARLRPAAAVYHRASVRVEQAYRAHPKILRYLRIVDLAMFLVIFAIVVANGVVGLVQLFLHPLPPRATLIPGAALDSFLRLLAAYGVALGWTIPTAIVLGDNEKVSRFLTPVFEVVASLPATALLPLIVGVSILVASSLGAAAQLAAVLIALYSMQWYLLFNLIAGIRSIPDDLKEAARSFGLRGWVYWKRVMLPGMTPSLLTGSITAWGAGWNALIVSEYIKYAHRTYQVPGLGSLLNEATFPIQESEMLLLTILAMVVIVLTMNKLLWRPLFNRATKRYRLEG